MQPNSRGFSQIILLLAASAVLFTFQNCGVQRPQIENLQFASTGFAHTGQETSCSACHNGGRPTNNFGFISLNPNAPFDYDTHAAGLDCVSCHHATNAQRSRADWAGGAFKHASSLVSCGECHRSQRPVTYGNNTPHPTTGDCATCHAASMNTTYSNVATDWKGGDNGATGTAFDPAKNISLQSFDPVFSVTSPTSIAYLTLKTLTLNMVMNHSTKQISAGNLANCNLCHAGAASGNYKPGLLHSSLTTAGIAQPANCNDCHGNALPTGFVGPNDTKRNPLSPAMKHDAVTWSMNAAKLWSASVSKLLLNDCSTCHKQNVSTSSWGSAVYHTSLIAGAVAQPSSCLDCHANSRPMAAVKAAGAAATVTAFQHTTDPSGLGDCIACHSGQTTWAGANFHSNVATLTARCYDCHSGTVDNSKGFNHGTVNFATTDCTSCHTLNRTAPTWAGANGGGAAPILIAFPGQTGSEKTTIDYVNSTLAGNSTTAMKIIGTTTNPTLPHPNVGTTACTTCHTSGGTYAYLTAKAYDHGAGVAGVTTLVAGNCASCHEAGSSMISTPFNISTGAGDSRPVGMTTMTVQGFQPGTCTISGSNTGVGNHFYPTDCSTCHVMPGSAIVGASTGAPTSSASPWAFTSGKHTPKGVSCSVCHANSAACKEN